MRALFVRLAVPATLFVVFSGCATEYEVDPLTVDPWAWEDEPDALADLVVDPEYGKPLLDVATDDYRLYGTDVYGPKGLGATSARVWEANRRWYQVTTEAGPGWSANSGLTWDQKYAAWIDAMEKTQSDDGWMTVELTTPWGKKLPSPRLECAEMALFLRATFAAWYELPFFVTAYSSTIGTVHYGHFGIVDKYGNRVSGSPTFKYTYKDYTATMANQSTTYVIDHWPSDSSLRTKYLTTAKDDEVAFLGDDLYFGAYADEVHLNKRVGHFLIRLLTNFGSMHLAGARNTWDLAPEQIREGDVLLQRWQSQGIGHTVVVKEVDPLGDGKLNVEAMFGSMPRIQLKWYDSSLSKSYFTSPYAGSAEMSSEGVSYSRLGGGLKRWRTPVYKSGYWVNIVPSTDRAWHIADTDYPKLEARVETFRSILGNLTPEEERDVLLERISMAREALSEHPSSCTNRTRREDAFEELYTLSAASFGMSKAAVDAEYRKTEDYVFAELVYDQSITCCWNSTTSDMHDLVMAYNQEKLEDAASNGQCLEPTVFKAVDHDYATFRDYASSVGKSSLWAAWSKDETCPADVPGHDDVEAAHAATPFCDIADELGFGTGGATTGCNGLTWEGECDGNTVRWCENDTVQTYACSGSCGWVSSYGYYWCL